MNYNPKDATTCLPAGEYDAVLQKVEDTVSKKGNEMLHCVWQVYTPDGRSHLVDDYIVNPSTLFKLKKIAKALGRLPDFEDATFQLQDFIDSRLVVDLGVQEQQGFDDKNQIGNYRACSEPVTRPRKPATPSVSSNSRDDGDIPFSVAWLMPVIIPFLSVIV